MSALVGVGGFFVFAFGVISFFIYFRKPEKRKNSKYMILGGIVLFIVGLFIPSPEDTSADQVTTSQESFLSEPESTEVKESIAESAEEPAEDINKIGEIVPVGDVAYTVNSFEISEVVGGEYLNETAQGIFLIVNVTVTNNGNESLDISNNFFTLVDGEKRYESSTTGSIYANEDGKSFFVNSINPDLSLTSNVVFDVSQAVADSSTKQLEVQTGFWGTETGLINLQ